MFPRLLLIALAAGCSAPATPAPANPPPAPAPDPSAAPPVTSGDLKADGASCLEAADCASGVCEGQGCGADAPGTCAPKMRGCTRDLREYCGCDGVTFQTSGSCPGRRFSARDACN